MKISWFTVRLQLRALPWNPLGSGCNRSHRARHPVDPQPLGEAGPDAISQPLALTSSAVQIPTREAQGEAASPPSSSSRPPGCGTRGGPSVGLPGVTHWAGCLFGRTHSGSYGRCPAFQRAGGNPALFSLPPGHHRTPEGGPPLPHGAERGSLHSTGCYPTPALVPAAGRGHVEACGGLHVTVICLHSCPSRERT